MNKYAKLLGGAVPKPKNNYSYLCIVEILVISVFFFKFFLYFPHL